MATSADREKRRSVEVTSPVRKGVTPQEIFSCLYSSATVRISVSWQSSASMMRPRL